MLGYRISYGYLEDKDLTDIYNFYMQDIFMDDIVEILTMYYESAYSFLALCSEIRLRKLFDVDGIYYKVVDIIKDLKQEDEPDIKADDIYSEIKFLREKYIKTEGGRLIIPKNTQELWAQHKYSIMARDYNLYKSIGIKVGRNKNPFYFDDLLYLLSKELRVIPKKSGILNTLQHMWGYISKYSSIKKSEVNNLSLASLFFEIQQCTLLSKQEYLIQQTALSELEMWILGYKEQEESQVHENK